MPRVQLAPGVHAVLCGGDLVLLDLSGSGYACLPGVGGQIGLRPGVGEIEVASAELAAELGVAGFLTDDFAPSGAVRHAPPPRPARDLMDHSAPWPGLAGALDLSATLAAATAPYQVSPFGHLVGSVRRRAGSVDRLAAAGTDPSLEARVLQFRRLLPWVPFQGVCLYRSYMLLRHLRRRGLDALWVFGVQTWPFAAHCWLQVGDTVLDDTADNAAAYAPILVV